MASRTPLPPLALAALLATAASTPGHAAESYDNCIGFVDTVPTIITTQGVWCLRGDIATNLASGAAITIATNNVTLDCNRFKLGNLAAGTANLAVGVLSSNRLNATVTGCNIRGFREGISLAGTGGGHAIVDNRIEAATFRGIYVDGPGARVSGNRVFDTGGTALYSNVYGIQGTSDLDVIDNSVNGVDNQNASAFVTGIYVTDSVATLVSGNRVRNLESNGADLKLAGIRVTGNGRSIISGNYVVYTGAGAQWGLMCTGPTAVVGNQVTGFAFPLDACTDGGGNLLLTP